MAFEMFPQAEEQPMSRTYQYRKVMKPMLERKRRARINRCLDELKDLMMLTLQNDGENISKLEKADILELTVAHLHKLRRQEKLSANTVTAADRFRAGYTKCAQEVSKCLASIPGVDITLGKHLMTNLGLRLKDMDDKKVCPLTVSVPPQEEAMLYQLPLTPNSTSSRSSPSPDHTSTEQVWRPW